MKQWTKLRDATIFIGGMTGFLHEVFLGQSERPELLILCAAMMGLPLFLPGHSDPQDQDNPKDKKE